MDSRGLLHARATSFLPTSFLLSAVVSSISFVGGSVGCSQGSDIQIQGPAVPTAPQAPASGGTSSGTSDGTTNPGAPKGPGTPSDAGDPAATPPPRSLTTTYRVMCDDRYPPYVSSISSLATSYGFGAGLNFGEANSKGQFNPATDFNLEDHLFPQVVKLPAFGEARVLVSAKRKPNGLTRLGEPRFVFLGSADIVNRGGAATQIASEAMIASGTQGVADQENLSVRTFGASDLGKYLLIGQADGYRIVDSTSLKTLGTIKTGSASVNVNPELRESDLIFSVASVSGSSFSSRIYSLGFSKGVLQSAQLVSTTSGLRRPLVSVGPRAGESFAALDTSNRLRLVSPLKTSSSSVKITGLPAKGRLSSAAAVWREPVSRTLRAAIIFENFVPGPASIGRRSYKIEQVFVRMLEVNESTLVSSPLNDFEYPPEASQTITNGYGVRVIPGASDFRTAPDGKAIFALFPGEFTRQVYRLNDTGLDRVSQTSCTNMSIGVEP